MKLYLQHGQHVLLLLAALVISGNLCSVDLLELAIGPRLKITGTRSNPNKTNSSITDVERLTRKYGYPLETYRVISEQGYIIALHRIPYGRKQTSKKRPVALLFPGLFGAPECFLFRGPHVDLPYLLADAGYDMWFINNRGNSYSKEHISLNAETDKEYWNFSFHELGMYDMPATIDFILNKTQQHDLFYIGYSMGTAVGQVFLSQRPEYNSKVKLAVNLAPTIFLKRPVMPIFKLAFTVLPSLSEVLYKADIVEVLPRRATTQNVLTLLCQNGSRTQALCVTMMFLLVGFDYKQFNTDIFPEMYKYFPDGTSLRTILHYRQIFVTGQFKAFDYGKEMNQFIYNADEPYEYDVRKVTAPQAIYYGDGDYIATSFDAEYLAKKLPNVVGLHRVSLPEFNHVDFMWGTDVRKLLYEPIISLLNKYRQF